MPLINCSIIDGQHHVLRKAILWNDTRTTKQCEEITETFGQKMLAITRNRVLEGFTLPKIRWVQEHEPELFQKAALFLLPITFSLQEFIEMFRNEGKMVDTVISTGGGAKNNVWLQMQADIFDAKVVKLQNKQGPAMGAAMIAAAGSGIFDSLEQCANVFIKEGQTFRPDSERAKQYRSLFSIYQRVYDQTKDINEQLQSFRA